MELNIYLAYCVPNEQNRIYTSQPYVIIIDIMQIVREAGLQKVLIGSKW